MKLREACELRCQGVLDEIAQNPSLESLRLVADMCAVDEDSAYDFGAAGGHFALQRLLDQEEYSDVICDVIARSDFPSPRRLDRRPRPEQCGDLLLRHIPRRQTQQADTGFVLWPCARLLSQIGVGFVQGKTIELGAGLGYAGLSLARLARMTLSDNNDECLSNLEYNVRLNDLRARVVRLDFCNCDLSDYDRVIASDVICCADDARGLARALVTCSEALIIVPHPRHRYGVDALPDALTANSLSFHVDELVHDHFTYHIFRVSGRV